MVKVLTSGSVRRISHAMLIEEREVFRLLHPETRQFWCGTLPGVFADQPVITYNTRQSAITAYNGYLRWREGLKKGTTAPRSLVLKIYKVQTIEVGEEEVGPDATPAHNLVRAWMSKHSKDWRGKRSASAAERDLGVITNLLFKHGLDFAYISGIEWKEHMAALQDPHLKDVGAIVADRVVGFRNSADYFCFRSSYPISYTIDFNSICEKIEDEYGFSIR